jgi:hypothetical protein
MPRFKPDTLTAQQQSFVDALLADPAFNVTEAARKAGYATPNKSGWRLMRKDAIQRAIGEGRKARSERTKIEADDVLTFLRGALIQNPLALFTPGPNGEWTVKSLDKIPKEYGPFIEAIAIRDGEVSIRLVSKSRALEACMKHLGLYRPIQVQTEQKLHIDWEEMLSPPVDADEVEREIAAFPDDMSTLEKRSRAKMRILDKDCPIEQRIAALGDDDQDDSDEPRAGDLLDLLNSDDDV